jgi:glycosyltransferase involved in cell wall biosynthesis
MRILLTSNAPYAPPKGGSTRSNLIWLRRLTKSGHACRVVCPTVDDTVPDSRTVDPSGIEIHSVHRLSRRTALLSDAIHEFQPDWVLVSSEDLSHVLLRQVHHAAPNRLVYLAHTPQWYPFGPASWHTDGQAAEIVRQAAGVVAISHAMAEYIEQHCGAKPAVIHPPMYGEPPYPRFDSFDKGYVLMINPCVVKGISIFLALAGRFPDIPFAALTGWGTTRQDREAMSRVPNITTLETVPGIDAVLAQSRLLLMPSLWLEGFGLIAMEAMLRGLPVIASDSGGLKEAKAGTGFVIPVRPIERFEPVFDETHMPKPVDVPQDISPWETALRSLLTDRAVYDGEAERSRQAAIGFVSQLDAADFERYLLSLQPAAPTTSQPVTTHNLTPAQRALLLKRLRQREHK